jgi:hypothetical protein
MNLDKSGNMSRKEIIELYEWLLKTGKIKENGPAHTRLKELKFLRGKIFK